MKRFLSAVAILGAVVLAARAAEAQSASITATATVLQPLSVTGAANLNFGNVFPGTNVSVAPTAAGAGRFELNGVAGAEVQFSLTLPSTLTSGGSNSIPITFSSTDGRYNTTADPNTGATTFNPNAPVTTTLHGTTGDLFVYLGGTVSPSGTTPAGTYTGTITLNASYTGN
ncbi:MAG: hypothetical protein KatS3mg081_1649 [Gemmatimonadales bacterium]|nr:MAG: hypothetical protein KatS3mg081_1649 [Gemmatimonadales bacterium]